MIQVVFQNLESSELAKEITTSKMESLFDPFPDLEKEKIVVTLGMDNSQFQSGPDYFRVKVRFPRGRYRKIILEKSADNLYLALAETVDALHVRLNRFIKKNRVLKRTAKRQRKFKTALNFYPV